MTDDDDQDRSDDDEREHATVPLAALIEKVMAQVEKNISAKEASGELDAELSEERRRERDREDRAKLMRLVDRRIPQLAALVLLSQELEINTPAMICVRDFMVGGRGSFVISGGVGCGKSIAAAWAVAQRVRDRYVGSHPDGRDGTWPADYHPRFIDAAKLARLPRFAGKGEAALALAPFETCSVLAIDDVGMENDEFFAGILDSLVVTRHDDGLRTILTTNMRADEFEQRYGQRVKDRVAGTGGFCQLNEPTRRIRT